MDSSSIPGRFASRKKELACHPAAVRTGARFPDVANPARAMTRRADRPMHPVPTPIPARSCLARLTAR